MRGQGTGDRGQKKVQRWYPQKRDFATHQQWDAHRQAFDQLYALQDQVAAMAESLKKQVTGDSLQGTGKDNSITGTKIAGIYVKSGQPQNGHTIRYNSATGQFEFGV